jgi:hypothetical protein
MPERIFGRDLDLDLHLGTLEGVFRHEQREGLLGFGVVGQ